MCPPFELTFSPQTTIARGLLYVYVSEEIIHIFISIYHIFNINPKIRDSSLRGIVHAQEPSPIHLT